MTNLQLHALHAFLRFTVFFKKYLSFRNTLQQTTNIMTSFLIFYMIFHENRLPADDPHEMHALYLFFFLKKAAKCLAILVNYGSIL